MDAIGDFVSNGLGKKPPVRKKTIWKSQGLTAMKAITKPVKYDCLEDDVCIGNIEEHDSEKCTLRTPKTIRSKTFKESRTLR